MYRRTPSPGNPAPVPPPPPPPPRVPPRAAPPRAAPCTQVPRCAPLTPAGQAAEPGSESPFPTDLLGSIGSNDGKLEAMGGARRVPWGSAGASSLPGEAAGGARRPSSPYMVQDRNSRDRVL